MGKTDATKPQIEKFKDAARELETDDREASFDRILKKVAKSETVVPNAAKPKRSPKR